MPRSARRGFDSLTLLLGWQLWKERNARSFGAEHRMPASLLILVVQEANLWVAAGFKRIQEMLPLALANASQTIHVN